MSVITVYNNIYKIRQTQLDLYIHIKCCFWATSFGLIMTIIKAPYAKNISYL